MIITLKDIKEQFDIWNEKAFNGELPTPTFELMRTKSLLGQFCPRKVMGVPTYKIRISVYYDRPLASYIDTIVHEMLHFYIKFKDIKDTSSHGREWKRMAAELSRKFNLTITRTNPAGGGVSEAVIEKKQKNKYEYVFVCRLINGRYGAAVAPSKHLHSLSNRFRDWRLIRDYSLVKAPWAQTYKLRHLRTLCGIGYIQENQYNELMQNNQIQILSIYP